MMLTLVLLALLASVAAGDVVKCVVHATNDEVVSPYKLETNAEGAGTVTINDEAGVLELMLEVDIRHYPQHTLDSTTELAFAIDGMEPDVSPIFVLHKEDSKVKIGTTDVDAETISEIRRGVAVVRQFGTLDGQRRVLLRGAVVCPEE